MGTLLIEDMAKELGKKKEDLTQDEIKLLCLLIDLANKAHLEKEDEEYDHKFPENPPDINTHELNEFTKLIMSIFNKITEQKKEPVKYLKKKSDEFIDIVSNQNSHVRNFTSYVNSDLQKTFDDYPKMIKSRKAVFTKVENFLSDETKVVEQDVVLKREIEDEFKILGVGSKNLAVEIDNVNSKISISFKNIDFPKHLNSLSKTKDPAIIVSTCLNILKIIFKSGNSVDYESTAPLINEVIKYLKNIQNAEIDAITPLHLLLDELISEFPKVQLHSKGKNPKDKFKDKLAHAKQTILVNNPCLREWTSIMDKSLTDVNRVVLIGEQDLLNQEVMDTLQMILDNKNAKEKVIVVFNKDDVIKVNNSSNANFTLQIIGHGRDLGMSINANLGPFKGAGSQTGNQVAGLVNQCEHINKVRLTACYSGALIDTPATEGIVEKQRAPDFENPQQRRTYTLKTDSDLKAHPYLFKEESAVTACWNGIKNKESRDIQLIVSPGIVRPSIRSSNSNSKDEKRTRKTYLYSDEKKEGLHGAKEIRLQTSKVPIKPKTKW